MNNKRASEPGFSLASGSFFGFTQPQATDPFGSNFGLESGRVLLNNSEQLLAARLAAKKTPLQDDSLLQIVHDLEGLMKDEELSDFTFAIDGQNFKVHKAILAGRSPILRKMFLNEYQDGEIEKTVIKDISKATFEEFIRFIYTGKVKDLDKHVIDLMALSQQFEIETLKKVCETHLASELKESNALEIFNSVHRYRFKNELKQSSFKLIQSSFSKFNFKIPDKFIDSPDSVQKAIDLKKGLEDLLKDEVISVPLP